MHEIMEKKIKLVTNAGGLDPVGLKLAIEKAALDAGLPMPKVAAITGDDLMYRNSNHELFKPFGHLQSLDDLESFPSDKNIVSLNAYLGAGPIAYALDQGADIVVTGRCVDSALALGPLIQKFKVLVKILEKLIT